ncbi:hypothetical protein [Pseudomonas sp. NBRC 100443]|uniref:hypothetical protein n=1 Tax=Pseudomonas sp. NBRC 100443 TaxID=1113665 RepID=UPI0024A406A6|nr:hypothetical protein [Pseudomonas sp. NBRC 100443]GLU39273.1 hypothetical protein Pssp01_33660 [Pseudomonas sp. NBRC 100443]
MASSLYGNLPGLPPNVKPLPAGFEAGTTNEWIFFFVAGAAVVLFALPWALRAAAKKNWIPLLVMFSGLICSLEEAMLDMLGHLHWADDLIPAYTNFGITVPLLIPLCYVAFLGLQSYFCYFVIRNGATYKHFLMLLAMGGILDAIMETIGINLNVYEYYGIQPFTLFNFPYWWAFINSASFVTVGCILTYAVPRLKGWKQLLILLAAPYGMAMTYFTVGWIHILAHNSGLPEWARWAAATIMMIESIFYMKLLHHLFGAKEGERTANWTLLRMFAYTMMPEDARNRLWKKMATEGELPADRLPAAH